MRWKFLSDNSRTHTQPRRLIYDSGVWTGSSRKDNVWMCFTCPSRFLLLPHILVSGFSPCNGRFTVIRWLHSVSDLERSYAYFNVFVSSCGFNIRNLIRIDSRSSINENDEVSMHRSSRDRSRNATNGWQWIIITLMWIAGRIIHNIRRISAGFIG